MTERILLQELFAALPGRDFGALPWQPFRPGIEIVRVYGDGQGGGPSAALLRYAPGAQLAPHAHVDFEHIVILSGSQSDEHGTYGVGSVLIHGPGRGHLVRSEDGCVALGIWNAPVQFDPVCAVSKSDRLRTVHRSETRTLHPARYSSGRIQQRCFAWKRGNACPCWLAARKA